MSALLSEVFQTVLPTCEVVAPEQAQVREQVALERASFRERTSHWVQDQRAALAVCHECARRWWDGLSAGERGMRLQRLGAEFEALSVWQQQAHKRHLEERRAGCTPPRASGNPLRCVLFTTAHLGIFLLTQSRAQTRRVIIEPAGSPSGVAKTFV